MGEGLGVSYGDIWWLRNNDYRAFRPPIKYRVPALILAEPSAVTAVLRSTRLSLVGHFTTTGTHHFRCFRMGVAEEGPCVGRMLLLSEE